MNIAIFTLPAENSFQSTQCLSSSDKKIDLIFEASLISSLHFPQVDFSKSEKPNVAFSQEPSISSGESEPDNLNNG